MTSKYDELIYGTGYTFEMNRYFSEGWGLFKKGAGSFIGFTLLYVVISFLATLLPFVNFFVSILQYILIAGFFTYCRGLLNKRDEFSLFFEGFKSAGQIILYLLVLLAFSLPIIFMVFYILFPVELLPEIVSGDLKPEAIFEEIARAIEGHPGSYVFLYAVIIGVAIYLYISYSLAIPLIVDDGHQFWDAMELSRRVIARKFFHFLGMYILLFIIVLAGTVITCGLGLLVLFPFVYCLTFSAYDNIFQPKMDEKIIDESGDSGNENDINKILGSD